MSRFRLDAQGRSVFGPLVWLFAGVCVFTWFYFQSAPSGVAERSIAAAGPDGVTAYFASPEAAVVKINQLLAARAWTELGRYYDFSMSSVRPRDVVSGEYFTGGMAVVPEPAMERPFPPGFRFLYSERTELDQILRVVVISATLDSTDPTDSPQASFFLRSDPEGFRVIPTDAAGRLKAAASAP